MESPLVVIEQRVLRRAKDETLDLEGADAARRVRSLVADEVEQWRLDHKHGLRAFDLPDPELVIERLRGKVKKGLEPAAPDAPAT